MEQRKRRWNPVQVRRHVRLQDTTTDGMAVFTTKSFTNASDATDKYHPVVDLATGAVLCDCPHFVYRLAKGHPTIADESGLCKHLLRAVATLRRRGLAG